MLANVKSAVKTAAISVNAAAMPVNAAVNAATVSVTVAVNAAAMSMSVNAWIAAANAAKLFAQFAEKVIDSLKLIQYSINSCM